MENKTRVMGVDQTNGKVKYVIRELDEKSTIIQLGMVNSFHELMPMIDLYNIPFVVLDPFPDIISSKRYALFSNIPIYLCYHTDHIREDGEVVFVLWNEDNKEVYINHEVLRDKYDDTYNRSYPPVDFVDADIYSIVASERQINAPVSLEPV